MQALQKISAQGGGGLCTEVGSQDREKKGAIDIREGKKITREGNKKNLSKGQRLTHTTQRPTSLEKIPQ